MDELKKKQVLRKRLYGKVVRVALVIALIVLIRPTWNIYSKSRESERNLNRANEELQILEKRQNELAANVASIKSETGRDEEIREKFGVAKAGETVVVIVDDKKPVQVVVPEQKTEGFWSKVLSWFGVR